MKFRIIFFSFLFFWALKGISLQNDQFKQSMTERQLFIMRPLQKQIQKKEIELRKALETIKNKQDFLTLKDTLKEIKEDPFFVKLQSLTACITTLNNLSAHHTTLMNQALLFEINALIDNPFCPAPLCTFFKKERVRLMDVTDEAILLNSLKIQSDAFKNSLQNTIKITKEQVKASSAYQKFNKAHALFLTSKEARLAKALLQKLSSLEHEQLGVFFKDKETQNFIYENTKEAFDNNFTNLLPLKNFEDRLSSIKQIEYDSLLSTTDSYLL